MAKNALTSKQSRFVEEILVDLNGTQAAIRAGYSKSSARQIAAENMSKPVIMEAIAKAKAERSERTEINADYVLTQAVKLHERCMQEIEPYTDAKGSHITDGNGNKLYIFNASGAAKALDMVGKHVKVRAFDADKSGGDLIVNIDKAMIGVL